MKHVLILNQFALPRSEAGGTRHVDLFARVDGWEFRIVAGHLNHYSQQMIKTDDDRFLLVRIPPYTGAGLKRMTGWLLFGAKAVVRSLRTRRPDVVFASTPHLLTPVAGAILATLWGRPLIVEIRDLWPETLVAAGALRRNSALHRALVSLERWTYRRADHLVAVTTGWEQHFADMGVPSEKVTVVSNGTEASASPLHSRHELRRRFGLDGVTAVYAGAHGPANALDAVLDAAAQLPDLQVLLIGAGPEKVRLLRRAEEEGMNNVSFRNPLAKDDLIDLLHACDIGIHSIEPLAVLQLGMSPNKLFDYMAAGLPVVSNAGEGLARVINDDECGIIGGPTSLAESLRTIMVEGDERRRARGVAGKRVVVERFSRTAAAVAMKGVLENVR